MTCCVGCDLTHRKSKKVSGRMSGSAESLDESVAGLTLVILITFSSIDEDNKPELDVEL